MRLLPPHTYSSNPYSDTYMSTHQAIKNDIIHVQTRLTHALPMLTFSAKESTAPFLYARPWVWVARPWHWMEPFWFILEQMWSGGSPTGYHFRSGWYVLQRGRVMSRATVERALRQCTRRGLWVSSVAATGGYDAWRITK